MSATRFGSVRIVLGHGVWRFGGTFSLIPACEPEGSSFGSLTERIYFSDGVRRSKPVE